MTTFFLGTGLKVISKEGRDKAFWRFETYMMSLESSTSSGAVLQGQEETAGLRRVWLEFEEEDELDAELSRLLIDKLGICNL